MIHDTLLVSSPGADGGLFLARCESAVRLSHRPVTGLFLGDGRAMLAYQDDGGRNVRASSGLEVVERQLSEDPLDLHDLKLINGEVFAAATELNGVLRLDEGFKVAESWKLPGEGDSSHLNSLAFYDGKLLASAFGRFDRHRQYKSGTAGKGIVFDVRSGETFVDGLSQPHSLTVVGDQLFLCNSECREVRVYQGHELVCCIDVPGYARGLAISGDAVYVGLSRSRNVMDSDAEGGSAAVVVINRETFQLEMTLSIGCREIYDIAVVDQYAWVLPLLIDDSTARLVASLNGAVGQYKDGYEAYQRLCKSLQVKHEAAVERHVAVTSSFAWKVLKPLIDFEASWRDRKKVKPSSDGTD